MAIPHRLQEISDAVAEGLRPKETVRTILSWFGFQRRGREVTAEIRRALRKLHLGTDPALEHVYLDADVTFISTKRLPTQNGQPTVTSGSTGRFAEGLAQENPSEVPSADPIGAYSTDPTFRIGRLESANRKPLTVAPTDTLELAITRMLAHDYSQLPVMTSERSVQGLVSWRSIGRMFALASGCKLVRECLEEHRTIDSDASLFDAIQVIIENECVLVKDRTGVITGIVTPSDLSLQFRYLGEPFLLLSEIENHVRRLIGKRLTLAQLQAAKDPQDQARVVEDVADLTFGEYIRILESPERWQQLRVNVDRAEFRRLLDRVREIRNDVMHFDPDGIEPAELDTLRDFVRLMQTLSECRAI